jgi:hypothetical protein
MSEKCETDSPLFGRELAFDHRLGDVQRRPNVNVRISRARALGIHGSRGMLTRRRTLFHPNLPHGACASHQALFAWSSLLTQSLSQLSHVAYALPHPPARGNRLGGVEAMLVVAVVGPLGPPDPGAPPCSAAPSGHGGRPAWRSRAGLAPHRTARRRGGRKLMPAEPSRFIYLGRESDENAH